MNVKDGRAAAQKKIADKNIERVVNWFDKNPDGNRAECAKKLKLGYWTVCRIIKGIQEGK